MEVGITEFRVYQRPQFHCKVVIGNQGMVENIREHYLPLGCDMAHSDWAPRIPQVQPHFSSKMGVRWAWDLGMLHTMAVQVGDAMELNGRTLLRVHRNGLKLIANKISELEHSVSWREGSALGKHWASGCN